jgi:hypothetical protein
MINPFSSANEKFRSKPSVKKDIRLDTSLTRYFGDLNAYKYIKC